LADRGKLIGINARYPKEGIITSVEVKYPKFEKHTKIGITGRALRDCETQIVNNVLTDEDYIVYDPNTRSEIAVPIRFDKEAIGVISIEHPKEEVFDENDKYAMETLAVYSSISLRISKLLSELAEKEEDATGLLEQTLEEQGELIGQVFHREIAHDIKNLVETIQYSLKSIDNSPAMNKFSNAVKKEISDTSVKIDGSLEAIRDFLKLADESRERVELFDINTLVIRTLTLLGKKIEIQDIEVDKSGLEANLPKIEVNRLQLIRVVFNLIDNAIGALSKVKKHRIIRLRSYIEDGRSIRVDVEDNGIGINREDFPRIFEPYFSTKETSSVKGRGLGLAGSKRIIETYKGRLFIAKTQYGKGTTFSFRLPISSD
jgi:signal transduction histidine kinase